MFPVDAFRSTVGKAVAIFWRHGIAFHLTGGIATVFYGQPRLTQNIDMVIGNSQAAAALEPFLDSLEASDFISDPGSIREAVANQGMFQLLDRVESLKLGVYPGELIPGELSRSILQQVFEGEELPVASRADVAVSKLVWISKGSHQSRRDLRQIYRLASPTDRRRIEGIASQLDLAPLLDEVLAESDEIP